MSAQRITMQHVRAARLDGRGVNCAPHIRGWCARHGIDYRAFARDGMPIEQVQVLAQDTGDAFLARVLAVAQQETH